MLTEKQKIVINWCIQHDGKITKREAMQLINDHYCNGAKHVGEVLSRMVKAGLLNRITPGNFSVGNGYRIKQLTIIENQQQLF